MKQGGTSQPGLAKDKHFLVGAETLIDGNAQLLFGTTIPFMNGSM